MTTVIIRDDVKYTWNLYSCAACTFFQRGWKDMTIVDICTHGGFSFDCSFFTAWLTAYALASSQELVGCGNRGPHAAVEWISAAMSAQFAH